MAACVSPVNAEAETQVQAQGAEDQKPSRHMSGSLPGCSHPQTLNAPLHHCRRHPRTLSVAVVGFQVSAATLSRLTCPLRQTNKLYLNWQARQHLGGVAKRRYLHETPGLVDRPDSRAADGRMDIPVCRAISPCTSQPASQANPRGSSHSKEPKPGRPRLTYLITADPLTQRGLAGAACGSASVVRSSGAK